MVKTLPLFCYVAGCMFLGSQAVHWMLKPDMVILTSTFQNSLPHASKRIPVEKYTVIREKKIGGAQKSPENWQ